MGKKNNEISGYDDDKLKANPHPVNRQDKDQLRGHLLQRWLDKTGRAWRNFTTPVRDEMCEIFDRHAQNIIDEGKNN